MEAYIFITSLQKGDHSQDRIEDILLFCETPLQLAALDNKLGSPVEISYSKQKEELIIKIAGNDVFTPTQHNEFWTTKGKETSETDIIELSKMLIQYFQNIRIAISKCYYFIHWGLEQKLSHQNLKALPQYEEECITDIAYKAKTYPLKYLKLKTSTELSILLFSYSCYSSAWAEYAVWRKMEEVKYSFDNFKEAFHFLVKGEARVAFERIEHTFLTTELDYPKKDILLSLDEPLDKKWQELQAYLKFNTRIYKADRHEKRLNEYEAEPTYNGGNLKYAFVRLYQTEEEEKTSGLDTFVRSTQEPKQNIAWDAFKEKIESLTQKNTNKNLLAAYAEPAAKLEEAHFLIAFARMEDFTKDELYKKLEEAYKIPQQQAGKKTTYLYRPIIVIGLMDVMLYYNTNSIWQAQDQDKVRQRQVENAQKVYHHLDLDKRFRFFDSSIWWQYVGLSDAFDRDLEFALHNIQYNWEQHIYHTYDAIELLEYRLRLLRNSYIVDFTANNNPTEYVTPYIPHTESRMRLLAEKEWATIQNFNIDIMFVDDYSKRAIPSIGQAPAPTKEVIIKNALIGEHLPQRLRKISIAEPNLKSYSEKGKALDAFIEAEPNYYNLHIINYYLAPLEKGKILSFNADYGFELVRDLYNWTLHEDKDKAKAIGPFNRWNIVPESTFYSAFIDKLIDLGIPRVSRYININSPVDPICTPQLFRYTVYYRIRRQIESVAEIKADRLPVTDTRLWDEEEGYENYQKTHRPKSKLAEYIKDIAESEKRPQSQSTTATTVHKKASNKRTTQYAALQNFPKIVELGTDFKRLFKYKKKSPFAKNLIERFFFGIDSYAWDHIQQFIYLLSFGTFQQKQEMWEEYSYIKQILESQRIRIKQEQQEIEKKKYVKEEQEEQLNIKLKILTQLVDELKELQNNLDTIAIHVAKLG